MSTKSTTEKAALAIKEKVIKAVSRNKYDELKSKKEWDQKAIEDLSKTAKEKN